MEFSRIDAIDKGWSGDKKFSAWDNMGKRYFLRISPLEKYEARKLLFDITEKIAGMGVPMCEPIDILRKDDGVYTVYRWVHGEDAESYMEKVSDTAAENYGRVSGELLKIIHSVPAPENQPDWEERFNKKIDRKIDNYNACELKIENDEKMIEYLNANRCLLKNRPQSFQHGDYHIGNMMVEDGKLIIIDFDRMDFGDPWEEFNRIVWCAQKCPAMAKGMIDGYFDGNPPEEFWKLLKLYIFSNTLSSVPWAIPFGEKEISVMVKQAKEICSWYDGLRCDIPTWYIYKQTKV